MVPYWRVDCLGTLSIPWVRNYTVRKEGYNLEVLTKARFTSAILNLPIAITAKALSAKKAKEALASSSVKIAGRDVLATWKFLVGLVLLPTLYGFYTLIVLWICFKSNMDWFQTILYPLITWTMLPFVSYASMRFAENGVDVFK